MSRVAVALGVLIATASLASVARAGPPSVIVMPADSGRPDGAITSAVLRGARTVSPRASIGRASLVDAAFITGCDPEAGGCLEEVRAQLRVGQLVVVRTYTHGGQTIVELTATQPDGAPRRRNVAIGDDRRGALAELEAAMPRLLGGIADAAPGHRTPRGALVITIGGGVLLGAGLGLWGLSALNDDADEESRNAKDSLGTGLVLAGSIAVVGGVSWILWDRHSSRAVVTPVATARTAGLAVVGSW